MTPAELLDPRVAAAFYGQFRQMRAPQSATVEPLLAGNNIVLAAGTGSGKTEAVLAPLVSRYWRQATKAGSTPILYVAPTKALVNDLEKRIQLPLASLGLRVAVRHGDRDDLAGGQGGHVLVTTPESLDVLLFRGETTLQFVQAVVIDEVHLLYNTQRGLQLAILLQRLRSRLARELQWAALSATIGDLAHIQRFLFGPQSQATLLRFPAQRSIDAHVRQIADEGDFLKLVRRLVGTDDAKLLVFVDSRRECERLATIASREPGLERAIFAHYSSLSPDVRVETERSFAASRKAICIATSTLELGIDIGDIDAVVLWGAPGSVESFLQRVGRGNRRATKTNVVSLIPDNSPSVIADALRFVVLVDAAIKGECAEAFPAVLYGAVVQQCLSIIASEGGKFTRVANLLDCVSHLATLDRATLESILNELAAASYLQRHGFKNQFGADEKLHELVDYRLIYGNFPAASQSVEVRHGKKVLGTVPAANLLRLRRSDTVRFAGKSWTVMKTSRDGIGLAPTTMSRSAVDFIYATGTAHVTPFMADRIWRCLHRDDLPLQALDASLREHVQSVVRRIRTLCTEQSLPYVRTCEGVRYFTFAGNLINRAIAALSGKHGCAAGELTLSAPSPLEWATLPTNPSHFETIADRLIESTEQSVFQQLLPRGLQVKEVFQEFVNDAIVATVLRRLATAAPVEVPSSIFVGFE